MDGESTSRKAKKPVVFPSFSKNKKAYSIALILSRFLLSLCLAAVSFDTWRRYKELSIITSQRNDEISLETIENFVGDLDWVPIIKEEPEMPVTYGTNRFFNLYLISLSQHLHKRTVSFLAHFSSSIFLLLIIICIFDIYLMLQKRIRSKRFKISSFVRGFLFLTLFGLVFSQFIFTMYYKRTSCSFETLYPFLFLQSGETTRMEFLKAGSCKMMPRFVAIYVISFLTLIPDAFLVIIQVIKALRMHTFLNGIKYFAALFFLSTAFLVLEFRWFVSIGQNPNILDYRINKYNENLTKFGRQSESLDTFYRNDSFKMVNMKDAISYRVNKSLKDYSYSPNQTVPYPYNLSDNEYERLKNLTSFNFSKQLNQQSRHKTEYYFYFGIYESIITLIDAIAGTILVIKRHRFLLPIVAIVNFFYFCTHFVAIIMLQFPLFESRFFCNIKEFAIDEKALHFETLALSDLICKMRDIFHSCFALLIFLLLLAIANVANLYLIHKFS